MSDPRFVEELVWERDPNNINSYVASCLITKDLFRMVWSAPCWCLRLETTTASSSRPNYHWMGQFTEPGGIAQAKRVAQKFHDKRLRAISWETYMKENDPPWPTIPKGPQP